MSIFKRFAGFYAAYKARSAWVDYAATCGIGDLLLKEMDNLQAPNNIEVTFTNSDGEATATVTVCRIKGKSPAQQLDEMKQQRDELLEALDELTEYAEMAMEQANKAGAEWEIGYALHEAKFAIAKAKGGAVNHSPGSGKMVVQDGWKLVPKEPTSEMLLAASCEVHSATYWGCAYRAMLAASPKLEWGAS